MDREDRSDRDNKKIRNAKRSGKFRSGLEKHMSESLKNFSIPYEYEKLKYVLMEKFVFAGSSYERMKSGDKIVFKEDSRATRGITYTPDFSIETERSIFIIECKGHKTDAFILK